MSPEAFLADVAQPNMAAALDEPNNLRALVNAILTLDALAGIIHAHRKASGRAGIADYAKDDNYREELAHVSASFRVLRDAAASIKHGELTAPRKKLLARLLHSSDAMRVVPNTLGLFECGDSLGGDAIVIEFATESRPSEPDERPRYVRASDIVADAYRMLKRIVEGGPAETDEYDRASFAVDDEG